ncbi:hypothetical protein H0H93_000209 [Arthromyces matolae]|nr:hypothetical protein H0H93_000209 [Arthromyces matolae]
MGTSLMSTLNLVAFVFVLFTFNACATPLPLTSTVNTRNLVEPSADSGVKSRTSGEIKALGSIDSSLTNLSIRGPPNSNEPATHDQSPTHPPGIQIQTDLRRRIDDLPKDTLIYRAQLDHVFTNDFTLAHDLIKLLGPYPETLHKVLNSGPTKKVIAGARMMEDACKRSASTLNLSSTSKSSSLSSTSSSGSTAQTVGMRPYSKELEAAAKSLVTVVDAPNVASSTPSRATDPESKPDLDSKITAYNTQLEKNREERIEAARKLFDTLMKGMELGEELVRKETANLTDGDRRYTEELERDGGMSYRDTMVLPKISLAQETLARQNIPDRVREAAQTNLEKLTAIDDRLMKNSQVTVGMGGKVE